MLAIEYELWIRIAIYIRKLDIRQHARDPYDSPLDITVILDFTMGWLVLVDTGPSSL